jgi:hypothetical protein
MKTVQYRKEKIYKIRIKARIVMKEFFQIQLQKNVS